MSVRRVHIALSSACPDQDLFRLAWERLDATDAPASWAKLLGCGTGVPATRSTLLDVRLRAHIWRRTHGPGARGTFPMRANRYPAFRCFIRRPAAGSMRSPG